MAFSCLLTTAVLDNVSTSPWAVFSFDLHYNWPFWLSSLPLWISSSYFISFFFLFFSLSPPIGNWGNFLIHIHNPNYSHCARVHYLFISYFLSCPCHASRHYWIQVWPCDLLLPVEYEWIICMSYLRIGFKYDCVFGSVFPLTLTFHYENSMYQVHMWPGTEWQNQSWSWLIDDMLDEQQ